MAKKAKISKKKHEFNITIFALIIMIIVAGALLFKKPAVTGKVIQGGEAAHNENLNLKINESGTYEWKIKNPGSITSLKATGSVTSNGSAKVYIEKDGQKTLVFDSTKQLFDVNVDVLPEYKKILPGDKILVQIALINLRGFGSGAVNVRYDVRDSKGSIIASQNESVFVATQAKFVRELVIPLEISFGTYTAYVEAYTNIIVGTGSDSFEIMPKSASKYPQDVNRYLLGLAAIIAVIIVFIAGIYGLNVRQKKKEIEKLKKLEPMERIEKLEKELKALEEAYKSGFISKESYEKEKKRIEERLGVFKKE